MEVRYITVDGQSLDTIITEQRREIRYQRRDAFLQGAYLGACVAAALAALVTELRHL